MFYNDKFAEIYSAILSMYHAGRGIDIITVKTELDTHGKLELVGSPFEMARLSRKVDSSAHLEYHALLLCEKYIRQVLIVGFHKQPASA